MNPATIEANRNLARQFFAEQDKLRGGPAPELCAANYRAWLGGNPTIDRAGHEGFAKAFYAGFPDLRHEVEQVIATEEQVAVRFVLHGTNTGSLFGMPPSGKPATIAAHVLMRVTAGKVTELFGIFDEAGMLRQIGVLPG
jgi:predicted ester cyclase